MDRKADLITRVPLFASLEGRSLEAVATLAREIEAPAGTVLMREGDPAESFYLLCSGTLNVERAGTPIRTISEGGFVGEIALVGGSARTATVTCSTDCRLLVLGSYEFGRVMATFPEIRDRVVARIRRRPHGDVAGGDAGDMSGS
jgi:CRP-like cAMP-binding protein